MFSAPGSPVRGAGPAAWVEDCCGRLIRSASGTGLRMPSAWSLGREGMQVMSSLSWVPRDEERPRAVDGDVVQYQVVSVPLLYHPCCEGVKEGKDRKCAPAVGASQG